MSPRSQDPLALFVAINATQSIFVFCYMRTTTLEADRSPILDKTWLEIIEWNGLTIFVSILCKGGRGQQGTFTAQFQAKCCNCFWLQK